MNFSKIKLCTFKYSKTKSLNVPTLEAQVSDTNTRSRTKGFYIGIILDLSDDWKLKTWAVSASTAQNAVIHTMQITKSTAWFWKNAIFPWDISRVIGSALSLDGRNERDENAVMYVVNVSSVAHSLIKSLWTGIYLCWNTYECMILSSAGKNRQSLTNSHELADRHVNISYQMTGRRQGVKCNASLVRLCFTQQPQQYAAP